MIETSSVPDLSIWVTGGQAAAMVGATVAATVAGTLVVKNAISKQGSSLSTTVEPLPRRTRVRLEDVVEKEGSTGSSAKDSNS